MADHDIKIIDDYLDKDSFNDLQNAVLHGNLLWNLSNEVASIFENNQETCDEKYNYQFAHTLFDNALPPSPFAYIMNDFLNKLKPMLLIRAKLNINPGAENLVSHGLHIDILPEELAAVSSTCVFYLNTNNGYTIFDDGTKVESVENRIVIFPSNRYHSGTNCTDTKYRSVLNVNYILSEDDVENKPIKKQK